MKNDTNATRQQAITGLAQQTIEAVTNAANGIDALLNKLSDIKTVANNVRYRLNNTGYVATLGTRTTDTHTETGAIGVRFIGITDVFYQPTQAARYLGIKYEAIRDAIDTGAVYAVSIEGTNLIPQGALDIYREQGKPKANQSLNNEKPAKHHSDAPP